MRFFSSGQPNIPVTLHFSLHKKLTKLIAEGKTVEGYEKNLKLFAFAQYEEGATKLASPTFFVASRYIPHRVWKGLQEHPALFSQVQEELVQKFSNPCKEAPRFDIQAVFGEFPEVCAKLVEGKYPGFPLVTAV